MDNCNQVNVFLANSNLIYDIIYENDLDVKLWYGIIADTLMNIIPDCTEVNKANLRQLMEASLLENYNIELLNKS